MKIRKKETNVAIAGSSTFLSLPEFTRPSYANTLQWPSDITQLSSQNLTELIGKYTELRAFAQSQLTKATIRTIRYEAMLNRQTSFIFLQEPAIAHIEKYKRDQKIGADKIIMNYKAELAKAKEDHAQANLYVSTYESFISALSRELTRKIASNDDQKYRSRHD